MAASSRRGKRAPGRGRTPSTPVLQPGLEAAILARYAAVDVDGKTRRCGKRKGEDPEQHWRWSGNDGKPLMKDEGAARECAKQLALAKGKPVHAYRCPRSKSGHWHIGAGRPGVSLAYRQRRAAP